MSDFEREVMRLDDLAVRIDPRETGDQSANAAARHAACLFQRAVLTGDLGGCTEVECLVDGALARHPQWPDLWLLKAKLDFHLHRFDQAEQDLSILSSLSDSPESLALAADLDLERGRHAEAAHAYGRLAELDPSAENFCRLANLELARGRPRAAIPLFARAAEEITAKEMRTFAWVQALWGDAELSLGRPLEARRRYKAAAASYSGYWLVEQRLSQK